MTMARAIDADAYLKDLEKIMDELQKIVDKADCDKDREIGLLQISLLSTCVLKLTEQPTIETKHKWTSVEDELPKCHLTYDIFNRPDRYVSDAVLVSVKSNEVGGTRYFVGTDIMTGRTKEDIHWLHSCFYSGSAVYSQEITHWMPKPDPQKEV